MSLYYQLDMIPRATLALSAFLWDSIIRYFQTAVAFPLETWRSLIYRTRP